MPDSEPTPKKSHDIFISYAREDEHSAARPVAEEFEKRGFSVWLDRYELDERTPIQEAILAGLQGSYCPVVILGRDFLRKEWPKKELDILLAIEEVDARYRIVPIRHRISAEELSEVSPYLASRTLISTEEGIASVCDRIVESATNYAMAGPRDSDEVDSAIPIARFFDPGGLGKCKNPECSWRLPREAEEMGLRDVGPEYTLVRKQRKWYVACASCGMIAAGPVEPSYAKWILTFVRMHIYAPELAPYIIGDAK